MAQEAQVQHTTPTEAATHPPGTMTPKLNKTKKDKQLKAAAEAAAAEKKALDRAAQGAPRGAEAAAAHGAPVGEGGAAAAPAALAPTSAVEDTVVDHVDESQDEKPLSELTVAPTGDAVFPLIYPPIDTEVSGEDGQQQESPETQAPDGQQQESPESLYQRAQQESPETQAPEAQQQSPETQAQEACPPPSPHHHTNLQI